MMFVITRKKDLDKEALEKFKRNIQMYSVQKHLIFAIENYTSDNHVEDVTKDIEILEFLLQALFECDRNMSCIDRIKKRETENEETKSMKISKLAQIKTRTKSLFNSN